jgi:NitT/TauT family transport system substrate-binding protein
MQPFALAETKELRVGIQISIAYAPVMIAKEHKLIEKHAKQLGAGDIAVKFTNLGGVGAMTTALLSDSVDIGFAGPPGIAIAWARTRGSSNEIKGVSGLASVPLYLVTRNPAVKTIKDFTDKDRIALGAVKVSIHAIVLQMAAAQAFGPENFDKLDRLTVSMTHPVGTAAMLSPRSEITAHFTTPPYNYMQESAGARRILSSRDVLGGFMTNNMPFATAKFRQNNPKVYAAFLKAIEEANSILHRDRRAAVDLYLKAVDFKGSQEDVENTYRTVEDPETEFSLTPRAVGKLAQFLYERDQIKVKPADWRELFFPEVHQLPGS